MGFFLWIPPAPLFFLIVSCGLLLASRAPDWLGVLLGSGVVTVIGLQAIINSALATDTLPDKGMAMPLVSYGGWSLVMTLAALGVLLDIFQQDPPTLGSYSRQHPDCGGWPWEGDPIATALAARLSFLDAQ